MLARRPRLPSTLTSPTLTSFNSLASSRTCRKLIAKRRTRLRAERSRSCHGRDGHWRPRSAPRYRGASRARSAGSRRSRWHSNRSTAPHHPRVILRRARGSTLGAHQDPLDITKCAASSIRSRSSGGSRNPAAQSAHGDSNRKSQSPTHLLGSDWPFPWTVCRGPAAPRLIPQRGLCLVIVGSDDHSASASHAPLARGNTSCSTPGPVLHPPIGPTRSVTN